MGPSGGLAVLKVNLRLEFVECASIPEIQGARVAAPLLGLDSKTGWSKLGRRKPLSLLHLRFYQS